KEMLKQALANYDGTLLVVSHDRDFLQGLTNTVYEIQPNRMRIWPGDVMDFLKEKKAESIAAFEQERAKVKVATAANKVKLDPTVSADRRIKKMKNEIELLEKKIAQLEKDLESSNQILVQLDYTEQKGNQEKLIRHSEIESELARTMEEWEALCESLSKIEESN
ncbi:MAG: hypothetical protein ACKOSR_10865, partial [Flavobacteriales bacterium]